MLKSIHKPTHLRNFAGQTLGVDAYGWLHRGTVSCAIELAQQKPTRKHIDFALSRVRMLIHFGVKPYLVFDGDYLPSKAHTEKDRAAKRKESKKLGLELLSMGRISQAYLELQKAIDVTPCMARELIDELKKLDVPYVVAPYEADSQLAYLEKQGHISGVLSEDSDLLVFGVKCLLTKLDQYGECVMVNRADFTACREISLVGWTDKEFRIMAMLSGCDYLPGIDRMGLKSAYRLVRKHKVIDRIIRTVQFDGKMRVPHGYLEAFDKAEKTFLYQWVFCPEARSLLNLCPIPAELEISKMPFLGPHVKPEIAASVAAGDLDPNTKERIVVGNRLQYPASRSKPVQTPDEKQGKPISEFFKPKRTPLAELDPNSFTPSPSQQRLLEAQQGGTSWSASQVQSMRPPALNRVVTMEGPSSAPQAARRTVSNQWPERQRVSPKRQRLCSDSALAASMDGAVGLQAATSRFFAKQTVQPSPSTRKASNRKKDDFELWSDDSTAEAIAEMTETPEAAIALETPSLKKRKKLQVFADPEPAEREPEEGRGAVSAETSQTSATTVATQDSIQPSVETPTTSFGSNLSQSERTVFSHGINAGFAALKSKYTFESDCPRKGVSRTQSAPLTPRSALGVSNPNCLPKRSPNDLQSVAPSKAKKFQAMHEAADETTSVDIAVVPSSPPRLDPGTKEDDEIEDEEWLAMEQRQASQAENLVLQGSEDLLVPESPESGRSDGGRKPMMDLGQYAFAG